MISQSIQLSLRKCEFIFQSIKDLRVCAAASFSSVSPLCRLKSLFSKQGSLRGCFRNVKVGGNHVALNTMTSFGVSFGCKDSVLVGKLSVMLKH